MELALKLSLFFTSIIFFTGCRENPSVYKSVSQFIEDKKERIVVNDTLIIRNDHETGYNSILLENKQGIPIGEFIATNFAESIVNIPVPANNYDDLTKRNYGIEIFRKSCFGCHTPYDFKDLISEQGIKTLDDLNSFTKKKPVSYNFNEKEYIYSKEGEEHWRYFMLDAKNKEMLFYMLKN